ncbi:MAG: cellulase N-terminal Ig-like domain-containing protein, partial [Planctomycetota bacterium]
MCWTCPPTAAAAEERDPNPSPRVEAFGMVEPQTIWLRVREFEVTPASLVPYEPQPGDEIKPTTDRHGVVRSRTLLRNGIEAGTIAGPDDDLHVYLPRGRIGKPLDRSYAYKPDAYRVLVGDALSRVASMHVKRSPVGNGGGGPAVQHDLYLELAEPIDWETEFGLLTPAVFGETNLKLTFGPMAQSPAVHASHVGYRPSDPLKVAFLSQWMGTGGSYEGYAAGTPFQLRDAETGEIAFEGETAMRLAKDAESAGYRANGRNFAGTDVLVCDFSDFTGEGKFVVSVDGVGASRPFEIGEGVWHDAFHLAMRGILHQRSG